MRRRPDGGAAGPALPFGHPSPDTELHSIVQRFGQAIGPNRAGHADQLRSALVSTTDKEPVRVVLRTGRILTSGQRRLLPPTSRQAECDLHHHAPAADVHDTTSRRQQGE